MSFYLISVFVSSDGSVEELATLLEDVLGIQFKPDDIGLLSLNPEYYAYVFRDPNLKRWFGVVNFASDPYMDDGDKLFSHYNYRIEVGAFGISNGGERERVSLEFATLIFEKLKATNQYPLMMVKGVHPKLDQFDPTDMTS